MEQPDVIKPTESRGKWSVSGTVPESYLQAHRARGMRHPSVRGVLPRVPKC